MATVKTDTETKLAKRIAELEAKCAVLAEENVELKDSRDILSKNIFESCNAIFTAGFRHDAIYRGLLESTGNGNKYPNPITAMVDEAFRIIETPATDAFLAEVCKRDGND